MCCAQVMPEASVPSSQAGSQPSNVDHSVSQAGLDQPPSGEAGAAVYPWLVNTAVSASAVARPGPRARHRRAQARWPGRQPATGCAARTWGLCGDEPRDLRNAEKWCPAGGPPRPHRTGYVVQAVPLTANDAGAALLLEYEPVKPMVTDADGAIEEL